MTKLPWLETPLICQRSQAIVQKSAEFLRFGATQKTEKKIELEFNVKPSTKRKIKKCLCHNTSLSSGIIKLAQKRKILVSFLLNAHNVTAEKSPFFFFVLLEQTVVLATQVAFSILFRNPSFVCLCLKSNSVKKSYFRSMLFDLKDNLEDV